MNQRKSMTTDKLLEAYIKHRQAARRNARIAKGLQAMLSNLVSAKRVERNLSLLQVAIAAKIPHSRVVNILYGQADLKPSEAKALIQAING